MCGINYVWPFRRTLACEQAAAVPCPVNQRQCGGLTRLTKGECDTQGSHVITHRSTNWACWCLTSQIGRDGVLSPEYGRIRWAWCCSRPSPSEPPHSRGIQKLSFVKLLRVKPAQCKHQAGFQKVRDVLCEMDSFHTNKVQKL